MAMENDDWEQEKQIPIQKIEPESDKEEEKKNEDPMNLRTDAIMETSDSFSISQSSNKGSSTHTFNKEFYGTGGKKPKSLIYDLEQANEKYIQ